MFLDIFLGLRSLRVWGTLLNVVRIGFGKGYQIWGDMFGEDFELETLSVL